MKTKNKKCIHKWRLLSSVKSLSSSGDDISETFACDKCGKLIAKVYKAFNKIIEWTHFE